MRIEVRHQPQLDKVAMRCIEACDTDSRPIVPEVEFRNCAAYFDGAMASVAAAVVFADYCGEVIEFTDTAMGPDHRNAIERIVPHAASIFPVDATLRDIRQGRDTLIVAEAAELAYAPRPVTASPMSAQLVSWSGDFIDSKYRDPARYVAGQVFTNARLVAGPEAVSLAVGLIVGGRSARNIAIGRAHPAAQSRASTYREALALVGVSVEIH